MGPSWSEDGIWIKNYDLFTISQWPLIHILLINASIIYDTALSEDLVLP